MRRSENSKKNNQKMHKHPLKLRALAIALALSMFMSSSGITTFASVVQDSSISENKTDGDTSETETDANDSIDSSNVASEDADTNYAQTESNSTADEITDTGNGNNESVIVANDTNSTQSIFTSECGGLSFSAELNEAVSGGLVFVVNEITSDSTDYSYDELTSLAGEYLLQNVSGMQIDELLVVDMHFEDVNGEEIEVNGGAKVTVSFGSFIFSGDKVGVLHVTENGVEDVTNEIEWDEGGAVSSITLNTESFSPFVLYSASYGVSAVSEENEANTNAYEGTALKTYADSLFGESGTAEVASLTISQNKNGEILAGNTVTWNVDLTMFNKYKFKYDAFSSSYDETLFDTYENTYVTITAPAGITITGAETGGLDYVISTDDNGCSVIVIYFGDVSADSDTQTGFTVTAVIDSNPAPATGTTYCLTEENVTYATTLTVLDRDGSDAVVESYEITGQTSTGISASEFELVITSNDEWNITKNTTSVTQETIDGKNYVVATYVVTLLMDDAQWSTYAQEGRVGFGSFVLEDSPTATDGTNTYYPVYIKVVPENFTGETTTAGDLAAGETVSQVVVENYATAATLSVSQGVLSGIDGSLPVYSTYTVYAYYEDVFSSDFYNAQEYTFSNTVDLAYTLEHTDNTDEEDWITGSDTASDSIDYEDVSVPATINLNKYIQSIFLTGGEVNYVTGDAESFSGQAVFTILDENGDAASIYILVDGEYVEISNVITFKNGAMIVSEKSNGLLGKVVSFLTGSGTIEYTDTVSLYLNAGTYTIQETTNNISNTSTGEITSDDINLDDSETSGCYSFTVKEGDIGGLDASNVDTRGGIRFTKYSVEYDNSNNKTALAGAVFTLYSDETCKKAVATSESDSSGEVTFTYLDPGTYYIKETSTPDGYLLDETIYKVIVEENTWAESLTVVSEDSNNENPETVTSVSNTENSSSVTLYKYLLSITTDEDGNPAAETVAVDYSRIGLFSEAFQLQYSTDGIVWENYSSTTYGLTRLQTGEEEEDGTIATSDASYLTISGLPVYQDDEETPYYYRIVETLPDGYTGYGTYTVVTKDSNNNVTQIATPSFTLVNGAEGISLTNVTTGEVSMEKLYKAMTSKNTNGVTTYTAGSDDEYPAITGYICTLNEDGTYTAVKSGTTETVETEDGSSGTVSTRSIVTLEGLALLDSNENPQAYYWAELTETDGVSYTLEDGVQATVYVDGTAYTMYVSTEAAYASAYDSENSATEMVNIMPYRRVYLQKYAVYGSKSTSEFLSGAKYTIYRVVNGVEESTPYTLSGTTYSNRTIGSTGTNIALEIGYEYHVYETTVPSNASGLKDKSGEDIDYITIDLTNATASSATEIGTTYKSYYLYDEPYRTVSLSKKLVSKNGATSDDSEAQFYVYYSEDNTNGSWSLYTEDLYTANSNVILKPGYYYAFVEVERDGIIPPEQYTGATTVEAGYIKTKSGTSYYGFLTGLLEAGKEVYTMETVYNYENLGTLSVQKIVAGSTTPVSGAEITIYRAAQESSGTLLTGILKLFGLYSEEVTVSSLQSSNYEEVGTYTTGSDGLIDVDDIGYLEVYDSDGNPYTYYIVETGNPDGYFLSDTILTVTLSPGATTTVNTNGNALVIYDEPEVTVSVQVTWENCYEAEGESESGGVDEKSYLNLLDGATVAAYRKVTGEDGTVTYEYVASAESDATGYAVFNSLSRTEEYVFILVSSGVTKDTEDSNYPLYASEDGSKDYLDYNEHPTLAESELDGYSYVSYTNSGETSYTFDSKNDGNLNNHLLYTQIHVLKYCTVYEDHDESSYYTLDDGTIVALVNGSTFILYRQELNEDQLSKLAAGESIEIEYDTSVLEYVASYESGSGGSLGELDFNSITYGEMYVYWLVESSPAAAHTWPDGMTYYRVLLYASELSAAVTSGDATDCVAYTKNEIQNFEVPNVHNPGSPHEYFRTYLYMNKWQSNYDEYGNVISDEDSPLGGASFVLYLSNADQSNTIALLNGQSTESMSSKNSLGYLNPGAIYFTELFNDWITAIVNESGHEVSSVADISTDMLDDVSSATWEKYSGMLFVAADADTAYLDDLMDLAADDGAIAKVFIEEYNKLYEGTWSVSSMENVMASTGALGGTYGYDGYFAHIIFYESEAPANYLLNETVYEIYLQFKSTGPNGSANTKYFYLDYNYYSSDPSGVGTTIPQDTSLSGEEEFSNISKAEITNLPDPEYSVTITKYGYELNDTTVGMTDDELDDYFTGTASGSQRVALSDTTFRLQRYDSETDTWGYYTYDSETGTGSYVGSINSALEITTGSNGYAVISLPIGYYRLIETETQEAYETILDGSTVDGYTAARYFWVKNSSTGNSVNVYDPLRVNLTVEKSPLGDSGASVDGIEIILTDTTTGKKYTGTISGGNVTFSYLPAGTYTVSENVASGLQVTGEYFEEFTITVGYKLAVKVNDYGNGEVYIDSVEYSISDDAKGLICAYGKEDSIAAGDGYTDIVLSIHNPSKGELTITKTDANTGSTLSATTYQATFALYYMPFSDNDFLNTDTYVFDKTSTAPTFGLSSWDEDGWILVGNAYTTVGGKIKITDLTPGWYAVVETSAPTYYELADPIVTYVRGDMTENHAYTADTVTVGDLKKTTISVAKYFELSDFYSELYSAAKNYKVTFGLYVKDTDGNYYYASELGLATNKQVTVTTSYTSGTSMRNSSWWYLQVVQMGENLDKNGHYIAELSDGTVVTLDGAYYIKEDTVKDGNGNDISGSWWLSQVSFTESSVGTSTVSANGDGYYKLSGFTGNHTGTVTFTNNYGYAKAVIQKTGNNGTILTGATFGVYYYDNKGNLTRVDDAVCTDNGDGSYTLLIPMTSLTETVYYIYEESAPDHYMLNEEPLTVSLKSGDIKTYGTDSSLIMTDDNGVNLIVTKYDNVYANRNQANLLNGTEFTLFRRVYNTGTGSWGEWEAVESGITGESSGDGIVVFDTLSIDPASYEYVLIETDYDTENYVGMDSLYHNSTEITLTQLDSEITYGGVTYTSGYMLAITTADIGTDYYLTAYNQPIMEVTFYKTDTDDDASTIPTAVISAYIIDDSYETGTVLTQDEIDTLMAGNTAVATGTTSGGNDEGASSVTLNLPVGTYLVVETSTNSPYVIDKGNSQEVWYQVIRVEIPSSGKAISVDTAFVNVKQSYKVTLEKTADITRLESDIMSEGAEITYELDATVTATGPINNFVLEDTGLTTTKIYETVGSNVTEAVTSSGKDTYLYGNYTVTSLKIPTDAYYSYENLVFNSGNKNSFTEQIWASVTFTYSDGTEETQSKLLATVDGDYWTVEPGDSTKKVASFSIKWYDQALETCTGYELGSDFVISETQNTVQVNIKIDQQVSGSESYYAIAEFKNSATVSFDYTKWDTKGNSAQGTISKTAEVATEVPNVEAPELTISKSVENTKSTTRNNAGTVIIGDTLQYTLTLANTSSSLGMENPILIDLLPRGIDISQATADKWAANLEIITENSGLTISNVQVVTTDEGYTLLVIYLKGTLAASSSVELTMEATVGNTIINYLEDSVTNTVYVTSDQEGEIYNANPAGSTFKGDTGSWAKDIGADSLDKIVSGILEDNSFIGYGYLKNNVSVTYVSTNSVNLLKEVQGDLDGDSWYSGNTGGNVTANSDGSDEDDDGYARFRLTINNADTTKQLVNMMVLDIIPKVEDNYDFSGSRSNKWDLNFDAIISVTVAGEEVDPDNYTVWYYTGNIDGDVTAAWETAIMGDNFPSGEADWTSDLSAIESSVGKSAITAFLIVFSDDVAIDAEQSLVVTYQTTAPEMTDDEINAAAHYATYNNFSAFYKYINRSSAAYTKQDFSNATAISAPVTSNRVFALLSTQPENLGGMFWIDADGDGLQDDEDVTTVGEIEEGLVSFDYDTFNDRVNNYGDYAAVQALLDTASISLLAYVGAQQGTTLASSTALEALGWRYLFTGLNTANLLDPSANTNTNYSDDGVIWSRLAGTTLAYTYQLQAVIGGNVGIKYSLTQSGTGSSGLGSVLSYDPSELYGSNYVNYWNNVLRDSNFTESTSGSTISDITGTTIMSGSTTALSERFFLTSSTNYDDLSKDIGLVLYRDLEITKTDSLGQTVEGTTFTVYGPYAEGTAASVDINNLEITSEKYVTTVTTDSTGTATVENLLYFQEYIIVETEVSSGYDLNETEAEGTNIQSFGGDNEGTWILSIPTDDAEQENNQTDPTKYNTVDIDHMRVTNSLKTGTLAFSKTESSEMGTNGDPVSGATFTLSCESTDVNGAWNNWVASILALQLSDPDAITAMGITNVTYNSSKSISFTTSFSGSVTQVALAGLPYGTYTLTEDDTPDGYELGETSEWTVAVGDDGNGNASVAISYESDGDIKTTDTIGNTYLAQGDLVLKASKTEENYTTTNTSYTFQMFETDKTWAEPENDDEPEATAVWVSNGTGSGTVNFSEITYTKEGTYYYIVKESVPADTNYVQYDTTEYRITVEVTDSDDHNGTLIAIVTDVVEVTKTTSGDTKEETLITDGTATSYTAAFTNTYEAEGELNIYVTKQVEDEDGNIYEGVSSTGSDYTEYLDALEFTFTLQQGTDEIAAVQITGSDLFGNSNTTPGIYTQLLETITYDITDAGKTFTYTVTETVSDKEGNLPTGYARNQERYTITVVISDNGDNTLVVDTTVKDAKGTTVYTTANAAADADLSKVDIKADTYNDGIIFTNVYSPAGETSLTIGKTLNGSTSSLAGLADTFQVEITELALIDSKPYTETVTVIENSEQTQVTQWVTADSSSVSAYIGADGTVTFIPYSDYSVTDSDTAVYSSLNYTSVSTHWYLVAEVIPDNTTSYSYDDTEYFVKIETKDNGNGTLSTSKTIYVYDETTEGFVLANDSNSAEGAALIFHNVSTTEYSVKKVWDDNDNLNDTRPDSVTVRLQRQVEGSSSWDVVDNTNDVELSNENSWSYDWESLDAYDANGNAYTYRAVELDDDGNVIDTDNTTAVISGKSGTGSSYTVSYDTSDSSNSVITNTLQTGDLKVTKAVTGNGGSTDQEFSFTVLFELGGSKLSGTYSYVKTDAGETETNGSFTLGASGTYTFILKSGDTIEITGLPLGTVYTVTETAVTGYTAKIEVNGQASAAGTGSITTTESVVDFENYYAVGTLTLKGSKTMSNMTEGPQVFNYTVTQGTTTVATGTVEVDEDGTTSFSFSDISYTLADLANGSTITYTVSEDIPGGAVQDANGNWVYNGITYDSTTYEIKVTLYDDGEGNITAKIVYITIIYSDGSFKTIVSTTLNEYTFEFTNSYKATGETSITAQKLLDDATYTGNEFSFTLREGTVTDGTFTVSRDGYSETVTAVDTGNISFTAIQYSEAGTYWYRITEDDTSDNYICDDTVYYVKVIVTDDGAGNLTATKTYYKNGVTESDQTAEANGTVAIQFTNYTTTSFEVTKDWVDDTEDDRPDTIYVMLKRSISGRDEYEYVNVNGSVNADGSQNYLDDIVELTSADGWYYCWENLEKYVFGDASQKYVFTAVEVTVTKDGSGNITAFTELASGDTINTAKNDSQYSVSYGDVTDSNNNGINDITISNTLGGTLQVKKTVVNEINDSAEDGSFTFRIVFTEASGKTYADTYNYRIYTVDNDGTETTVESGTKAWTAVWEISLKDGQIFEVMNLPIGTTYSVTESLTEAQSRCYDSSLSDNSAGIISSGESSITVTGTNTYKASGDLNLSVTKKENYHNSSNNEEREYSFTLYAADVDSGTWTKGNEIETITLEIEGESVTGTKGFTGIEYTSEGTYYYIVEEAVPSSTYRTYDTTQYRIQVNIADSDDHNGTLVVTVTNVWEVTETNGGQMVIPLVSDGEEEAYNATFVNTYEAAGSLVLDVTKNMWYEDDLYTSVAEEVTFSFVLKDSDGNTLSTVMMTGSELSDGTLTKSFTSLNYTEADIGKSYTYTVTETEDTMTGYELDTKVYTVIVTVTDNGDNTLTATPVYTYSDSVETDTEANAVVFDNVYSPEGNMTLKVGKTLDGGYTTVPDGVFTCHIQSGTVDDTTHTFTADSSAAEESTFTSGTVTFTRTYDKEGVYWYKVTEEIPDTVTNTNDGVYTYDTSVYYVKVTVFDHQDGTLATTTEVHKGSPTGATVYASDGCDITFANISTTSYSVEKAWLGELSGIATRPSDITVQLMRKTAADNTWEEVGDTVTLSGSNEWETTWSALPIYADDEGTVYVYEAFELDESEDIIVEGGTINGQYGSIYTVSYSIERDSETGGGAETITNTLNTGELTVTKDVAGLKVSSDEEYEIAVVFKFNDTTLNAGTYLYVITDSSNAQTGSGTVDLSETAGTLSVKLKEDETLTVTGLPIGAIYSVTENLTSAQQEYYTKTYSNCAGTISKEVSEATITNTYRAKGSVSLSVGKTENYYGSSNTEDRSYTFELYEAETDNKQNAAYYTVAENWAVANTALLTKTIEIAGADTTGSGVFDTITYEEEGIYYYLIKEQIPDTTSRTYDTTQYYIRVEVADEGDETGVYNGTLVAKVTGVWAADNANAKTLTLLTEADCSLETYKAEFTNAYKASGTLALGLTKEVIYNEELYGDDSRGEDVVFTFSLEKDGEILDTVTVTTADIAAGNGTADVVFDALKYDENDIGQAYTYTVEEAKNSIDGYELDTKVYTVTVAITDNGDNTLTVTPAYTYSSDTVTDAKADGITFTNEYNPEGDVEITIGKTLDSIYELLENTFSATLRTLIIEDEENPEVFNYADESGGSDAETLFFGSDGVLTYTQHYDTEGVYWYEISEVIPQDAVNADDGIYTYDETKYYVKVTVTDGCDGTLSTTTEVHKNSPTGVTIEAGTNGNILTFENKSTLRYTALKVWEDSEEQTSRPATAYVQLQRMTENEGSWANVGDIIALTEENGWTYEWAALSQCADSGETYTYRVVETDADGNVIEEGGMLAGLEDNVYEVSYETSELSTNGDTGIVSGITTVTNTLKETGSISISKEVAGGDENAQFGFCVDIGTQESDIAREYLVVITDADGTVADSYYLNADTDGLDNNVVLKSGQTATIYGLFIERDVTVTEVSAWTEVNGTIIEIPLSNYLTSIDGVETTTRMTVLNPKDNESAVYTNIYDVKEDYDDNSDETTDGDDPEEETDTQTDDDTKESIRTGIKAENDVNLIPCVLLLAIFASVIVYLLKKKYSKNGK